MIRQPYSLTLFIAMLLGPLAALGDSPSIKVKRRTDASEEDLRKQLLKMKDIGLNQAEAARLYASVEELSKKKAEVRPDAGPAFYGKIVSPRGFAGLPWITGVDAAAGREDAEALHALSIQLRDSLMKSTPSGDVRPDAKKVKELLTAERGKSAKAREWKSAHAIPALVQLLQAENASMRRLLIEMLAEVDGKEASAALAQRAIFDLSPEVREMAIQALAKRPAREYWPVLSEGLRYPWPAAADHAAEAIAALNLDVYLTDLVNLLKEPDPSLTFDSDKKSFVREVVRLNHMSNCMVCHAPALSKSELLRGRVPSPGEDPPPLYYRETRGTFIRADITYLRQQFSVVQPVASPGKWPGQQRYDYFVLKRPATAAEVQRLMKSATRPRTDLGVESKLSTYSETYPQRDAVLFALRQMTTANPGNTHDDWARYLKDRRK
jgi:hypothetical protein